MKRSNILLAALLLIAITAVWWFLLIGPRNRDIDQARSDLEAAQIEEATLRTRIAQLQEIKESEVSFIFAIGEMETSIPTQPEADAFIEDITFLAQSTGVDVVSLSLSPPLEAALGTELPAYEISVALAIEGEYFEILGLLYGLESMERLVRVDSINLSPAQLIDETTTTEAPAEGEESSAGSETTAEGDEARQRTGVSGLAADLTLKLYTREGVRVEDLEVPEGEDTTTTTTTTTTIVEEQP